jgi:hypothetical protein
MIQSRYSTEKHWRSHTLESRSSVVQMTKKIINLAEYVMNRVERLSLNDDFYNLDTVSSVIPKACLSGTVSISSFKNKIVGCPESSGKAS